MAAAADGDVVSTADGHTGASKALEPLKLKARADLTALALTRGLHPVWLETRGVERLVTLESAITAHVARMIGISGLPLGVEFKGLEPREQFQEQHLRYLAVQARIELAVRELEDHDARLKRWQAAGALAFGKLHDHIGAYARKKRLDAQDILAVVDTGIAQFQTTDDHLANVARMTAHAVRTNTRIAPMHLPPRNWTASAAHDPWIHAVNEFLTADTQFKGSEVPTDGRNPALLRQTGPALRVHPLFWMATFLLLPVLADLTDIAKTRAAWAGKQDSIGANVEAPYARVVVLYATIRVFFVEGARVPRTVWNTPENTLKREAIERFIADVFSYDYLWFAQAAGAGNSANSFGFSSQEDASTRFSRLTDTSTTRRWLRDTFSGVEFETLLRKALDSQPL